MAEPVKVALRAIEIPQSALWFGCDFFAYFHYNFRVVAARLWCVGVSASVSTSVGPGQFVVAGLPLCIVGFVYSSKLKGT